MKKQKLINIKEKKIKRKYFLCKIIIYIEIIFLINNLLIKIKNIKKKKKFYLDLLINIINFLFIIKIKANV